MCGPTDSLLFAEDLVVYIARKNDISFRSKINVSLLRHELRTRFSKIIGHALLLIMSLTKTERRFSEQKLLAKEIPIDFYIKNIGVSYGKEFSPFGFLVRCAWICGLSISVKESSPEAMEVALFTIAEYLNKIPEAKFVDDEIWLEIKDCAEEILALEKSCLRKKLVLACLWYMDLDPYDF